MSHQVLHNEACMTLAMLSRGGMLQVSSVAGPQQAKCQQQVTSILDKYWSFVEKSLHFVPFKVMSISWD